MHPFLIQALYYGTVMVLSIGGVGVFLRGFFWKYVRARLSFGKYVMVKVRTTLRDYYEVGWVEDGFLVYKHKKKKIRMSLEGKAMFYRSIAVNWVDVDEQKKAISKTDYTAVAGFDAEKFSDLLTRALMRPTVSSGQEKLILVLLIVTVLCVAGCLYLCYMNYAQSEAMARTIPGMINSIKGTITGGTTNI